MEENKRKIPPLPASPAGGPSVGQNNPAPQAPKPGSGPALPPMPGKPPASSAGKPLPPAGRPNLPVIPGMPSLSGQTVLLPSDEIDDVRHQLESKIGELEKRLQEEREKILLQEVRAKEEEAMAAKVEDSIKDIQDRLRREIRESEIQQMLTKAETEIRDLEGRLASERQTWVETLKTQMFQRDSQEKEVEHDFELRIKELEKRWQEEKLGWSQALRSKDEELSKTKLEFEKSIGKDREESQARMRQIEAEKTAIRSQLEELADIRRDEKESLMARLETRDKEFLSLKAQQAMLVTQIRTQKDKLEQLHQLLEKMRVEKNSIIDQLDQKD